MIKNLVVSGCSFTMGGGLDNPEFHKYFESHALDSTGTWLPSAGKDGRIFCYENNWGYFLHKLLKIERKNYKNFAVGGGGVFRSMQSIFTFLRTYDGNPSELQIIYQIPGVNRVELPVNYYGEGACTRLESVINSRPEEKHLQNWVKYFQNTPVEWLRTLVELDKLNMICKARGIPLFFIDWTLEYERLMKQSMMSELAKHQPPINNGSTNIYSLYRQICHSSNDKSLIDVDSIISDLDLIEVHEIHQNPKNKIHRVIDGYEIDKFGNRKTIEVLDHHLSPKGAKNMAIEIFNKKFKKN